MPHCAVRVPAVYLTLVFLSFLSVANKKLSKLIMACILSLSIQNETSVSSNRVESPDFIAVL